MTAYGFRVYRLSVGKRTRWRTHEDLSALQHEYPSRVYELLKSIEDQVLKYRPDLQEPRAEVVCPAEDDQGQPVMVVSSAEKLGLRVSCEVVFGRFGDHEDLVGDDVVSITDRAAGRRYRIDYFFPSEGEYGFIAAETRKRFTPLPDVNRWIARQDALRLTDDSASDDWWRTIRADQVADRRYLLDLVGRAERVQVTLTTAGRLSARGRPRDVTRQLNVRQVDDEQLSGVSEEVLRWMEGRTEGAVGRVMGLVGLNKERLQAADLDFNNTSVQIVSDQTVSVGPGTVSDLFTYPLAREVRPSPWQWRKEVEDKVADIAMIEGIDLDL
jgi:hypothetical protein